MKANYQSAKINGHLVLLEIHEYFPTKMLDKANLWNFFPSKIPAIR